MHIVQVNYAYAPDLTDPGALLDRYSTLTGWSEAVLRGLTGPEQVGKVGRVGKVSVVQRFTQDAVIRREGVEYVFCREAGGPIPRRWSVCRTVARAVTALRPDVVHVNGLGFRMPTRWLRHVIPASTAIVVQDHAGRPPRGGWLSGRVQRWLAAAADAYMFTATPQASPWRQAGLIAPRQPVHQVLESSTTLVAVPRDVARGRAASESPRGMPAILWVGRLNTNKDPLTVLDGFEIAVHDLPDATLTIVYGEAALEASVRERVEASAALKSRVRLVGRVTAERMPAFYGGADLFVLGSHHESTGYALLEALACGVVPAVTDIPSFRVMTADGRLGRLWPPGNADACARALVESARLDLAAEQRRVLAYFDQELSWPAVGRRAIEIYEEVVTGRRSLFPDP
jgi:glycosyltransferase involved in cell wall biosynthesis